MRDLTDMQACCLRLLELGYDRPTALRLAELAVDDSQPAPGWTHTENQ